MKWFFVFILFVNGEAFEPVVQPAEDVIGPDANHLVCDHAAKRISQKVMDNMIQDGIVGVQIVGYCRQMHNS